MARTEEAVTRDCKEYWRALAACHFEKRWGNPYEGGGKADWTGCWFGKRFEIELKRPGLKPTPQQQHRLDVWAESGAITGYADGVQALHALMAPHMAPYPCQNCAKRVELTELTVTDRKVLWKCVYCGESIITSQILPKW